MDGSPLLCVPLAAVLAFTVAAEPCRGADPAARFAREFASVHGDAAVVLVGEQHGDPRSHALFAHLVEALAARGGRLLVGLEVPSDRSEDLQTALAGVGCPPFPVIDGPSYRELLAFLGRTRGGLAVQALDAGSGAAGTRDEVMAQRISAALTIGGYDQVVALVGNFHALKTIPWALGALPPPGEKLAEMLRGRGLRVASLVQWLPEPCGAPPAFGFHRAGTPEAAAVVEALWGLLHTRPPDPGAAGFAADGAVVWRCATGSMPGG